LVTAMYSMMASSSARVLRCTPPRICFSVSVASQRSTRLIHDAPVGVKCRGKRGRLLSQRGKRRLVRGRVIEDQMDVEGSRDRVIDGVEKLAELHGTMAAMTTANDRARLDVQGREERRRAMAHGVVSAAFHLARAHGQQRRRAIQGLDLRLLLGPHHQGAVRRIQVEADHIAHLLHAERVLRALEGFRPMWLQAEGAPDGLTVLWLNPPRTYSSGWRRATSPPA
jgi:hypothetical protein